jgi:hypothetical protein
MKKTPNAQRRTPNLEFKGGHVAETPNGDYAGSRRPKYDLEERLLKFTASIVQLADSLPNTKAGNHIAGQLLRCGTSPLANHGLIGRLQLAESAGLRTNLSEAEELIRIFSASVRTTEKNAK